MQVIGLSVTISIPNSISETGLKRRSEHCSRQQNPKIIMQCPDRHNSKTNGDIHEKLLTKIKSGKAHIFTTFISVSLSTVIDASTIYA